MTIGSFIIIWDSTAGSPLFGGSDIYLYCKEILISGKNLLNTNPNFMIETGIIADDETSYRNSLERRKGVVSYQGFESPKVIIRGGWDKTIGSQIIKGGDTYEVLTPARFWQLVHSNHQFYIRGTDSPLLVDLLNGPDGDLIFNPSNGIPLAVEVWTLKNNNSANSFVEWSINAVEDKDMELT